MRLAETSDLWWKTAVIYCLDVQTFLDWNDDGQGDLNGLTERIDYLSELGVSCLWLMPYYPTSGLDDGYDVTDYYSVDTRLGDHGDFVEVVRTAQDRGMRVIVDLVVNHTSEEHPWFVEARSSKDSAYRDFYVWRSDPPPDTSDEVVFPDQENSIWTRDEGTGEWYLHHFYAHQPDLNISNPTVRDEISKVMGFWLQLGVSGFRVDAVPYLLSDRKAEEPDEEAGDPHDYLRALRGFLGRRRGDAVMLGEVNLPHDQQLDFFDDQLAMQFDFVTMQQMYLSLARQDAGPLVKALTGRPEIPGHTQWANFVRNHDELTLDKLTEEERQEVFDAFGPEESMQLYGRGLRRRLPPMLDGDQDRIRMVYSLMFSLPGTPTLFYGEEIGMGENLELDGRLAVRSPMQWTAEHNGGFSRVSAGDLARRPPTGEYAPAQVNVADQRRDPDSLLAFFQRLIHTYRQAPELGWGDLTILDQPISSVLAHESRWDDRRLVAVHNLGAEPQRVPLRLEGDQGCALFDIIGDEELEVDDAGEVTVELGRYGCRWLRLVPHDSKRLR